MQIRGVAEAVNFFLPFSSSQTPNFPVTDSLVNQFETGDLRKTDWLAFNVVGGKNIYYPFKYKSRVPTTPATDYMMLRFAEMYLIRAEAAAQLNNLSGALTDVNTIRTRAGLGGSPANPTSQTAVLGAIMKERRTEMFTEWGNRWFDLNRTIKDTKYPSSGQHN
jgi:hypothetical protein